MASSDRDINLIIRAKNDASQAIDAVSEALKILAGVQSQVGQSAEKTDGLLGELSGALATLNRQAQGLGALGTVATQIEKASAAVERLENQAKAAAEAADPLVQKYQAAAAATAALTAQADQAKAALEAQAAATAAAKAQQDGLTTAVRQAESSYRGAYQAVRAAQEPSEALKQSYRDQLGALQALYVQQDQAKAAYAAQRTILTQARSDYQQLDTQLTAAAGSEAKLEAQSTRATAALERSQAALAKAREELATISDLGAKASSALGGVAATQDTVAEASKRTAEEISQVKAALEKQSSLSSGTGAAAGPAAQATAAYRAQIQAIRDAETAMNEARAAATALGADMAAAAAPSQELSNAFLVARANAAAAEAEYQRQATTLNELKGSTSGFTAYLEREAAVLAQVSAQESQAAGNAGKLANSLKPANPGNNQLPGSLPGGKPQSSDGTVLWGLRPYELQNLSYQINDIISGIISGQRLTQVAAQQGGQVFQLFQRQILAARATILAMLPEIGAAVAIAITLFETFKRIADEAGTVRAYSGQLAASADGSLYDPQQLAETTRDVEKLGAALKDARSEMEEFVKAGVAPEFLERFAATAQNVADVTGTKVPEAAKKFATAFTGGYDAIKRLDDAENFLTAAEREHIKTLFDEGNASEARRVAYEAFARQQADGAQKARGEWSDAVRNLGGAWKNFIDYLGQTPLIQNTITALEGLAKAAKDVTSLLPGADRSSATAGASGGSAQGIVADLQKKLDDLKTERANLAKQQDDFLHRAGEAAQQSAAQAAANLVIPGGGALLIPKTDDPETKLKKLDSEIAELEKRLAAAKSSATGDPTNPNSAANTKARDETLDQIKRETAALGDLTDQQRVRQAGEIAYQDEIRKTGDVVAAQAQQQLAVQRELDRQRRAVNYGGLADKIVQAESSGRPGVTNANSTAVGAGQFTEQTWLELFRKYFPAEAANLGRDGILELRKDAEITKQMIEAYARENAEVLQKAGVSVNEAALYLAHFLGPQGALKVLQADPNALITSVVSAAARRSNGIGQTLPNGQRSAFTDVRTAGDLTGIIGARVGNSDASRAFLDTQGKIAEDIAKREDELRKAIDDLVGSLTSDANAVSQSPKDKFVDSKVQQAQQAANQRNIPLSQEDAQRVRDAATADYAATQAAETRKKNAELEDELNQKLHGDNVVLTRDQYLQNEALKDNVDLTTQAGKAYADLKGKLYDLSEEQKAFNDVVGKANQIQQLQGQLKDAFARGDISEITQLRTEITQIVSQLKEALPNARAFAEAMGDQRMVAQLDKIQRDLQNVKVGIIDTKTVNDQLASGLTNAFDHSIQSLVTFRSNINGIKGALIDARNAFLQFAADFLRQIALMIIKQQLMILLSKTPVGQFISNFTNQLATAGTSTAVSAGQVSANAAVAGSAAAAATAAIPVVGPELAIEAGLAEYAEVLGTFLPLVATGLAHAGQLIGRPGGMSRGVPRGAFANAIRLHTGGIPGLAPGEVPTILKVGEEVLTEDNPRHILNAGSSGGQGGSQGGASPLKVVNAFDPADVLQHALADEVGQRVVINHVRQNKTAYRAALGVSPGGSR